MSEEHGDLNVPARVMQIAVSVDRDAIHSFVSNLRTNHPDEGSDKLADRMIRRTRWWAAGWGLATGLPANPWVAVPAAVTDAGVVLRNEVNLAARIALLYDPQFLDDGEPPYEILVPIFGVRLAGEFMREVSVRGAMGVTRAVIRRHLSRQTLEVFKRVALKYFGMKVTQRSVVKGTLPVVGGVVGCVWNYREVSAVGSRVKRYFEDQALDDQETASAAPSAPDEIPAG